MIIFGSLSFAEGSFFEGGFELSGAGHITGFYSRTVKVQPAVDADGFVHLNLSPWFSTGLRGGFLYAYNSNLNEGWSYPGFTGIEAGLEFVFDIPDTIFSVGAGADAGWYKYNLTKNYFFLPSATLFPASTVIDVEPFNLSATLPVKFYFHRQADIFMSAGLGIRMVFK